MKIFIISDTHWNHENIKKYENRPENFNEVIIRNWQKLVSPEDLVIHLGDVIFARAIELPSIMAQLPGRKILCRGNHDGKGIEYYMEKGFDVVVDYFVYDNIAFSHAPLTPLPYQTAKEKGKDSTFSKKIVDLNIHGHFHRGKHRGKPGFLDKYYEWDYYNSWRKKYHLIQIEDELRPFSLEEVLATWKGGDKNE